MAAPHVLAHQHGARSVRRVKDVKRVEPPNALARRQTLERAIAEEQTQLRRLEAALAQVKTRLEALQQDLAALSCSQPAGEPSARLPDGPRTPADKVKLFRRLFRGRSDLYPTRFVSKKAGKPGYAPACSNKFVAGVCDFS